MTKVANSQLIDQIIKETKLAWADKKQLPKTRAALIEFASIVAAQALDKIVKENNLLGE